MKKLIYVALFGLITSPAFSQEKASAQTNYRALAQSKDTKDISFLTSEMKRLAASEKEADVEQAATIAYLTKNERVADSLQAVQLKKFPKGNVARAEALHKFWENKNSAELERGFQQWIKDFPLQNYSNNISADYARSAIATAYAKEKNTAKVLQYLDGLQVEVWKGSAYAGAADVLLKAGGDTTVSMTLLKKTIDHAYAYMTVKKDSAGANFAASGYTGSNLKYAQILYDRKQYPEALKYINNVYDSKKMNVGTNYLYAKILMATGNHTEAFSMLDQVIKSGLATPDMAATFKTLYVKTKGSDSGFDSYTAAIKKGVLEELHKKLVKEMVNEPAADFSLKDLDGKTVTLSSLKGKTVILDFWATWCSPCKKSFPAMQKALNKYKNNPNVKFLFIHTWERSDTPVKDAAAYIAETKYPFQVLMDLKDVQTKQNKVVSSYKVYGIPAKFVIDSKGNTRFKLTGFNGSDEAAVDEISMMIDLCSTPAAAVKSK